MNPLSETWYEILKTMAIPEDGMIVEFAPGFKSKIGQAVALLGFRGEYHLIEPNEAALVHSLAEYRRILPEAKIVGHRKYLSDIEVGKDIPACPDALLANHAPDDVVLALATPSKEVEEFFSMDTGEERLVWGKRLWTSIAKRGTAQFVNETARMLNGFTLKLKPRVLILSHYKGKTLSKNHITLPNVLGNKVVTIIQKTFGGKPVGQHADILRRSGIGFHWVVKDFRVLRPAPEIFRTWKNVLGVVVAALSPSRRYSYQYLNKMA